MYNYSKLLFNSNTNWRCWLNTSKYEYPWYAHVNSAWRLLEGLICEIIHVLIKLCMLLYKKKKLKKILMLVPIAKFYMRDCLRSAVIKIAKETSYLQRSFTPSTVHAYINAEDRGVCFQLFFFSIIKWRFGTHLTLLSSS